jgi:tRNA(Ile)-lysidine synthase
VRGLTEQVDAVLDRRLAPDADAALAVALSGGGDSVALALMAQAWARAHGRRLLALTVDHRLSPHSAAWTEICAGLARRLGADFRALAWTGDKPAHGLPAAARAARHGLLADAARAAGASVILMGHTADDLAETAVMRAAGSTTPDPREWSPAPVWPQGRGVFLMRPLLGVRRAALREWLQARGEIWIEDPANADPRFARARARIELQGSIPVPTRADPAPDLRGLAEQIGDAAALVLPRDLLRRAAPDVARAFVAAAALCAAGTARPPRGDRLTRLAEALCGDAPVIATLAGARIEADRDQIAWLREAGEMARHGVVRLQVRPGEAAVWDGRYEIRADRLLEVQALAGHAPRLAPAVRAALMRLPARARGGLLMVEIDGHVVCPLLEPVEGVAVTPLAAARLRAACGLVVREGGVT